MGNQWWFFSFKQKHGLNMGFCRNRMDRCSYLRLILLWGVFCAPLLAESPASKVRQGNQSYEQKKYDEALQHYSEALAKDTNRGEIRYNLGNTLYRLGKYPEAVTELKRSLPPSSSPLEFQAHYNLGNALFKAGDLQGSIAEYIAALKKNSSDQDAKHNLELALRLQKEPQKDPQNKQENKKEDKQDQKKPSQQDQQKSDQNQPQKQEKTDQNQSPKQDSSSQSAQKPRSDPNSSGENRENKNLDRQEAERLLQAMEAKERQELQRQQLAVIRRQGKERDW